MQGRGSLRRTREQDGGQHWSFRLGEGALRLSEPESSCSKLMGDYLKLVCGLFEACHFACFGGYCWRLCEHATCHNWFDDQECYYLSL